MTDHIFAVLGDMHFGARNDSSLFRWHQERFLKDIFWPNLRKHNCQHVIMLGDMFDRGRTIATETLSLFNSEFVSPALDHCQKVYILIGNHDIVYRDRLVPNVLNELMLDTRLFEIIDIPRVIDDSKLPWLALPWLCSSNTAEAKSYLDDPGEVKHIFGHLEVTGGAIGGGRVFEGGIAPKVFKTFKKVYSGHFHARSTVKNVEYLSTPLDLTWGEAQEWHGFHFMNRDFEIVESVETPWRVHYTLNVEDAIPDIQNSLVRLEYTGRLPEKHIESLRLAGASDVRAINTSPDPVEGIEIDETVEIPETRTLLSDYIDDDQTIKLSKKALKAYMQAKYDLAMQETQPGV